MPPGPLPSVRTAHAGAHNVWVAASDGKVRLYHVAHDPDTDHAPTGPVQGVLSPRLPSTPSTPGRSPSARQPAALELVDEVVVTPTKKAVDRIALLPRLDKAILLSEGVMTFHALPSLAPLGVHHFPSVRGVATFALDEDELDGRGAPDTMHVCVFKRRTVHWLRVTNDGITSVKDLPLRSGALVSVFRRGRACVADAENYSIVDLEAAEALPLLPISQSPHPDPLPSSAPPTTSSAAHSSPSPAPAPAPVPAAPAAPSPASASASGPDPRQRPGLACVADSEFLIASHTGATTLGVFVNEVGEPCRGTLEWASNLRSLVIDGQYSIALLYNNTVEIHSIHTQEIVQVVTLPSSSPSSSSSSLPSLGPTPSPQSFQPRSLLRSPLGLDLGRVTGAHKLELVDVPLVLRPSAARAPPPGGGGTAGSPPRTPTKPRRPRPDLAHSPPPPGPSRGTRPHALTRVVLVARNALYALSPLTLVVQADALMDKGRDDDAKALADGWAKSAVGGVRQNPELGYVYLRLAYLALSQTRFARAFALFLDAACDPRLVVRLFADLRGPLMGPRDEVAVWRGVEGEVRSGKGVDEYILDNLNRNYSPHLKPDVESASTTVELRNSLRREARDALGSYLMQWRVRRRGGQPEGEEEGFGSGTAGDSRKVDMVVDTALVRLLAEQRRPDDIRVLLAGPNDCVLREVEQALHDAGMHALLAGVLRERGETARVLDIWTRIVDGEYDDPSLTDGVHKVFDLVWRSKDKGLVEKYGLWMLRHDVERALRLFTDPKQPVKLDTRDLFGKMAQVNSDAADRFLEVTVLQERDSDARLHADLVRRYIGRLGELLADPEAKAHLREQESAYASLAASTSSPPTLLSFLTSRYSAEGPHALLDRVRLKAILFLNTSAKYDVPSAKTDLEEIEVKGMRGLTLERVIVYGKLHLDRQALSLVLHTLHDLSTAETYALQSGDPLLASDVSAASALLGLSFSSSSSSSKRTKRAPTAPGGGADEQQRREALARLLVDMCVARPDVAGEEQVARLLETQAIHLDTLEVLPALADSFPLSLLGEYLSRSLRRSLHAQQGAAVLKALAEGQNLAVQERVLDLQMRAGGTVQLGGDGGGAAGGGAEKVVLAEGKGRGRGAAEDKVVGGVRAEKGTAGPGEGAVELDLR